METRQGLLTKLGLYTAAAVTLMLIGKKHIAVHKESRHRTESDSSVEANLDDEFVDTSRRPGFPENNPRLDYGGGERESKYVGAGVAYDSRTKGDRLSLWNTIWGRRD